MFRRNIARARQVWGSLGKFLRREGSDLIFSSKNFRAVVQVVLLFGAETWFLTEEIMHKLEGVHVGFLWQVTGMTDRNLGVILGKGGGIECDPGDRYKASWVIHQDDSGKSSVVGIPANQYLKFVQKRQGYRAGGWRDISGGIIQPQNGS